MEITSLLGGFPKTSVSKKTDYLVVGVQDERQFAEGATEVSKVTKFKELKADGCDIQLISDADFSKLIFAPSSE